MPPLHRRGILAGSIVVITITLFLSQLI
ncbi:hypothetical protein [Chryseobacterium sp. 52]